MPFGSCCSGCRSSALSQALVDNSNADNDLHVRGGVVQIIVDGEVLQGGANASFVCRQRRLDEASPLGFSAADRFIDFHRLA